MNDEYGRKFTHERSMKSGDGFIFFFHLFILFAAFFLTVYFAFNEPTAVYWRRTAGDESRSARS